MPQEKSNIKMLPPPEPMSRFFGFHLDLSLHVTPSRKKKMSTAPSLSTQARFSPENLHNTKQYTATSDPWQLHQRGRCCRQRELPRVHTAPTWPPACWSGMMGLIVARGGDPRGRPNGPDGSADGQVPQIRRCDRPGEEPMAAGGGDPNNWPKAMTARADSGPPACSIAETPCSDASPSSDGGGTARSQRRREAATREAPESRKAWIRAKGRRIW